MLKSQGGGKPKSVEARDALKCLREAATAAMQADRTSEGSKKAHVAFVEGVRKYNGAVLADKEAYGSAWPLETEPLPKYNQDVAKVARGENL